MKKLFKIVLLLIAGFFLTVGYLIFDRYRQTPEQVFPYPYAFNFTPDKITLEAPILLAGDRMGQYFSRFSDQIAETISVDLSKPIKIQSLATDGQALHRTLHSLKSLAQWPQILVYQGGSEEFLERKFETESMSTILNNIRLYKDDRIETFLILWPKLSRIVYSPHKRLVFSKEAKKAPAISEEEYLKRLNTELLLYEQELVQLVNMAKDRNTLLILTTTPLNLDVPPKKVCEFTTNIDVEKGIDTLKNYLKTSNPKVTYPYSSKLVAQFQGNPDLYFLHAKAAEQYRRLDEAKKYYQMASAYDCLQWRANHLTNSIIKKVASDQQVILFDFNQLVENDYGKNITFVDEIFPQNLYYEKGANQLGKLIKQILKL